MKKPMQIRALKIDAQHRKVELVNVDKIWNICTHIGQKCTSADGHKMTDKKHILYIDSDGVKSDFRGGFCIGKFNFFAAGNGLLCSKIVSEGQCLVGFTPEELMKEITWLSTKRCLAIIPTKQG